MLPKNDTKKWLIQNSIILVHINYIQNKIEISLIVFLNGFISSIVIIILHTCFKNENINLSLSKSWVFKLSNWNVDLKSMFSFVAS